jgi:hypothetical protein
MAGQFEQQLNALLLQELGYGKNGAVPNAETIGDFLYRLPGYELELASYPAGGNGELFAALDNLLADDCRVAREFHVRRAEPTPDA